LTARILVAGIGNIFLGDDGFGSEVVTHLADIESDDVRIVDYGIRGMHLAYDLLDGYEGLVLIDAVAGQDPPGVIRVFEVAQDDVGGAALDAHAMDPGTVLASLQALGGRLPRTVVVGCVPAHVDEALGLSPAIAAAVEPAAAAVRTVLAEEFAVIPVAIGRKGDSPCA
jgi:hydrogenase maturation protease